MKKTSYQKVQETNTNYQSGYASNLEMKDKIGNSGNSLQDFYREAAREKIINERQAAEYNDILSSLFFGILELFY